MFSWMLKPISPSSLLEKYKFQVSQGRWSEEWVGGWATCKIVKQQNKSEVRIRIK